MKQIKMLGIIIIFNIIAIFLWAILDWIRLWINWTDIVSTANVLSLAITCIVIYHFNFKDTK
jgi:hypothetical protein